MKIRTVVQLLSGCVVTSLWEKVTEEEFDQARDNLDRFVSGDVPVFKCLIQEGTLEQEVYIPSRNIDVMTVEVTSDEQPTSAES